MIKTLYLALADLILFTISGGVALAAILAIAPNLSILQPLVAATVGLIICVVFHMRISELDDPANHDHKWSHLNRMGRRKG